MSSLSLRVLEEYVDRLGDIRDIEGIFGEMRFALDDQGNPMFSVNDESRFLAYLISKKSSEAFKKFVEATGIALCNYNECSFENAPLQNYFLEEIFRLKKIDPEFITYLFLQGVRFPDTTGFQKNKIKNFLSKDCLKVIYVYYHGVHKSLQNYRKKRKTGVMALGRYDT